MSCGMGAEVGGDSTSRPFYGRFVATKACDAAITGQAGAGAGHFNTNAMYPLGQTAMEAPEGSPCGDNLRR